MSEKWNSLLPLDWADPSGMRSQKPRTQGLTMVIDKGMGPGAFAELLETAASCIDICKLGFGTPALYPPHLLRKKLELARNCGLFIMPGGTFFEIARRRASAAQYMETLASLGFNAVEISDGTFPLSAAERQEAIACAVETGLVPFTEFGKKAARFRADRDELLKTLEEDVRAGAHYVIVEARESGTVGIFDESGKIDMSLVREIRDAAGEAAQRLIWEAPRREQQVSLLKELGARVNLGNIAPEDVLSLEALRRGLRGDTAALFERGNVRCE